MCEKGISKLEVKKFIIYTTNFKSKECSYGKLNSHKVEYVMYKLSPYKP
jgi:hypothetical protein